MSDIGLHVVGLEEVLDTIKGLSNFDQVVADALEGPLRGFVEKIRHEQLSGRPGVNQVSGDLYNSLEYDIEQTEDEVEMLVGSDEEYIVFHEYGTATIPKRLTIRDEWEEFISRDFLELIEEEARSTINDNHTRRSR